MISSRSSIGDTCIEVPTESSLKIVKKLWAVSQAPPSTLPTLFMRHSISLCERLPRCRNPSAMPVTICTPFFERPVPTPRSSGDVKPPLASSALETVRGCIFANSSCAPSATRSAACETMLRKLPAFVRTYLWGKAWTASPCSILPRSSPNANQLICDQLSAALRRSSAAAWAVAAPPPGSVKRKRKWCSACRESMSMSCCSGLMPHLASAPGTPCSMKAKKPRVRCPLG
mmetsp:Transcript_46697/g.129960  ORF Transcript_46697/g.129960 Transcript_46697/m.129960 type:complete len:230 (+) Transcript_46697:356-1045(+)